MSKTTTKTASKTKPYPAPQKRRSGMKVSWNYYASEADAKVCAEAAVSNARVYAAMGYDFGYQWPGSISKPMETGEYAGLWEVCLP